VKKPVERELNKAEKDQQKIDEALHSCKSASREAESRCQALKQSLIALA
jgi:hypothetical protein